MAAEHINQGFAFLSTLSIHISFNNDLVLTSLTLQVNEGKLEEAVAMYSRATQDYPTDPRAWYSLGIIYYGISQETQTSKVLDSADVRRYPWEIQELVHHVREFQDENQQLVQAFRESKLVASWQEAAKLALQYFRKTLACNISNEDKRRVQTHIRLIEVQLTLNLS